MQSENSMPNESPEQKAEEERRYIAAHTVFHDIYIINQYLHKSIKY